MHSLANPNVISEIKVILFAQVKKPKSKCEMNKQYLGPNLLNIIYKFLNVRELIIKTSLLSFNFCFQFSQALIILSCMYGHRERMASYVQYHQMARTFQHSGANVQRCACSPHPSHLNPRPHPTHPLPHPHPTHSHVVMQKPNVKISKYNYAYFSLQVNMPLLTRGRH